MLSATNFHTLRRLSSVGFGGNNIIVLVVFA